ncbi:MAG: hypothetical protein GY702_08990 [Desulfobulbaceae bacterium]|nr:hypothetical protein [Desulfobulbaceae bacterium]
MLSSKYTFFYKFIFIFIWVIGFATGAREVLFYSTEYDLRWIQYAGTWIGIALFIFFATGSVKQVTINREKKQLEVSNFIKSITIPFSEIEDIDGSSLLSPKLIWFILKTPTEFGRKITFMPAHRPARGIGKHPVVMELRKEFELDAILQ